jgi:mannose-binding lectin 2
MQSRYFDFGDDTIVRADQYIRLTSDRQGQGGWLWSKMPFSATNWQVRKIFPGMIVRTLLDQTLSMITGGN